MEEACSAPNPLIAALVCRHRKQTNYLLRRGNGLKLYLGGGLHTCAIKYVKVMYVFLQYPVNKNNNMVLPVRNRMRAQYFVF